MNNQEIRNCNFSWCDGLCHWIILSKDKRSIYGRPLKSKEEAIAVIQANSLSDYNISHRK